MTGSFDWDETVVDHISWKEVVETTDETEEETDNDSGRRRFGRGYNA